MRVEILHRERAGKTPSQEPSSQQRTRLFAFIAVIVIHVFALVVRTVFRAVVIGGGHFYAGIFLGSDLIIFSVGHVEGLIFNVGWLFLNAFLVGSGRVA